MLMKTRKMLWTLCGLFLILCSCEQEEQFIETKNQESRISFKNTKDFFNTFNELSQKCYEEQIEWSKKHSSAPLLLNIGQCEDNEMINMPTSFQALFDKQLEVQINDSIFKYTNGDLYLITENEKIVCGSAFAISASSEEQPSTRNTVTDVTFGKLGMNHQNGCYPRNYQTQYNFKYVHELKSVQLRVNNEAAEGLFMTLKLEYKGRKWHEAGESRTISLNLKINGSDNVINNTIRANRNYDYLLCPVIYLRGYTSDRVWHVNISGTITHTMDGFPETKWVDTW